MEEGGIMLCAVMLYYVDDQVASARIIVHALFSRFE